MTPGDYQETPSSIRGGWGQFLLDAALWLAMIIGSGALAYSLAYRF